MSLMHRANPKKIKVKQLANEWRSLCNINKDAHIAISADEGDGKTVLGIQLVLDEFGGNLWDNVVYSKNPQEFYDKYDKLKPKSIIVFDEALDLLDRINWFEVGLKSLIKKMRGEVRKEKNLIFIYNVQLFRDLHSYFRNHRIRYWLELMPREWFDDGNYAFVLKRQRVPFITGKRDAWLLDTIESDWLKKMKTRSLIGQPYINMIRRNPFYEGEFKFNDVDNKIYGEYLRNRLKAKQIYEKDMDKKVSNSYRVKKEQYIKGKLILEMCKTKKKGEIAQILNVSNSEITRFLGQYRRLKEQGFDIA